MITLTDERRIELIRLFVCPIENDFDWTTEAQKAVSYANFGQFRCLCNPLIKKIYRELDAPALPAGEYAYIVYHLWTRKGGIKKDILNNPGVLEAQYRQLIQFYTPNPNYQIPEKKETNTMNKKIDPVCVDGAPVVMAPAFETRHYVYGKDITKLSDNELIDAIRNIEADINHLKAVQTKSSKISSKIAELNTQLKAVVKILDNK